MSLLPRLIMSSVTSHTSQLPTCSRLFRTNSSRSKSVLAAQGRLGFSFSFRYTRSNWCIIPAWSG